MKIAKRQLRRIIKEELRAVIAENNQISGIPPIFAQANTNHPKVRALAAKLQPREFTILGDLLYVMTEDDRLLVAADMFDDNNDPDGKKRAREPERQRAQSAEKELSEQGYTKV